MEESGKRLQAETDQDQPAQGQQVILGNMLSDLHRFSSGTGAQTVLDFKRAIVTWAPSVARSFGIKPDEVSGQESFDKLAAQLAQSQGAGSDYRMAINQSANPHSSLSPEGASFIIAQLQGNADYLRARAQLARNWPSKSDYSGFQDSVRDLDPRVFQMSRMTQEERQAYWKSLDSAEQATLTAAGKKARDLGLFRGGSSGGSSTAAPAATPPAATSPPGAAMLAPNPLIPPAAYAAAQPNALLQQAA